jgi:glycolate oxidase FAD binding subunit
MDRLARLIEHDDANLTASAQAGMKVATLQEISGQRHQFLAIDPPNPRQASIGGLAAANTNGPRRMSYGSVRDLVIGMKMILATGEHVKAGGKVVKNVAGYDLCKLFVGSLGTLGIITEVTFKMAPIPESAATVVARGPLAKTAQLGEEVMRSLLLPAAIAIFNREAAEATQAASEMSAVAVWAEGFDEAVTRHLRDMREMAEKIGLASEILREEPHRRLWERARDFGADGDGVLYRVTVPLASVGEVLATIDQWHAAGRRARIIAHAGSGTLSVLMDAGAASVELFPRLTALARGRGGHVVLQAAPPALKEGIDVWGPPPSGGAVMREVKRQFDPQGILNPGRFLAGL